MSKRIAKVYDGFLSYEKLKSTNNKPKKELSPSVGQFVNIGTYNGYPRKPS
jgi:hypothetical protein